MKECIEREAVEQIIAAQCGECADACLEFDGIQPDCNQCLLNGAAKAIKDIPAADVRPVVRGKWMLWMRIPEDYICDKCEWHSRIKTNFCPNCGADMREES